MTSLLKKNQILASRLLTSMAFKSIYRSQDVERVSRTKFIACTRKQICYFIVFTEKDCVLNTHIQIEALSFELKFHIYKDDRLKKVKPRRANVGHAFSIYIKCVAGLSAGHSMIA